MKQSTKKITLNFKYCCSTRFKKIYGNFIHNINKQYKNNDIDIKFNDIEVTEATHFKNKDLCCRACKSLLNKTRSKILVTTSSLEINIPKD